jgi:Ni,Fe-hydrogenase I small subunit
VRSGAERGFEPRQNCNFRSRKSYALPVAEHLRSITHFVYLASRDSPAIPLDEALRRAWLFGSTVHEGCDRGGHYEQAQFGDEYGSPLCIVKLGCWGPVVQFGGC